MEFIGPRIVEKTIGTKYSVEWDKHLHTVTINFKSKPQTVYTFDKMTKSLNEKLNQENTVMNPN